MIKHSRLRNTQYINKSHSIEWGFYYGRLLKGDKNELATRLIKGGIYVK